MFRRTKGVLRKTQPRAKDRVWSEQLGCWFRAVKIGEKTQLRIATGPRGEELFPTLSEVSERERAPKEQALADKNQAIADAERERAAKEQALERLAQLERSLREK
jgi:hypothetical protein